MEQWEKEEIGLYQIVSHNNDLYKIHTVTGDVGIMIDVDDGDWQWRYFGGNPS